MNKVLRVLVAAPGLLFLAMGARWLFDPASAAETLGMPLLEDVGRSSQVGDMASFFITLGTMIMLGVATQKSQWLYGGAMLLGFAAISRTIAAVAHDAAMATDMIGFEVLIAALLAFAASRIAKA